LESTKDLYKEITEKIIFLKMTSSRINKKETIQKLQQQLDTIRNGEKQKKRTSSI